MINSESPGRKAYPYPLPIDGLMEFCHADPDNELAKPVIHNGMVYAGNGYIAIRAHRGAWLDSDFAEASPAQVARFHRLHWPVFEHITTEKDWRMADEQRGTLFQNGRISFWLPSGALNASPVWMMHQTPARLSLLQMAAILPRCEFYTGNHYSQAVAFRFSGGIGMIPALKIDPRTIISRTIFQPRRTTFNA